jgi:hypothetical protein
MPVGGGGTEPMQCAVDLHGMRKRRTTVFLDWGTGSWRAALRSFFLGEMNLAVVSFFK